MNKYSRAQSAMEYLMTYGWAILIIAVVLGALFSLGVFGGGAGLSNACVAVSGYQCKTPVLSQAGTLSFTFGQNTGGSLYNMELACGATSGVGGLPSNALSFMPIQASGAVINENGISPYNAPYGNTIVSGQTIPITGLQCQGATQPAVPIGAGGSVPIGTSFSGSIWANYTVLAGTPSAVGGGAGTFQTTKMATITMKVT